MATEFVAKTEACLRRQAADAYPPEVLREAVVNAVAHRDYSDAGSKVSIEVYSDRLLVSSPGHPPGRQPIDRLARGEARSRARNPLVVQGLAWLNLMDERGSGIPRMTRLLHQAGQPPPVFRPDDDYLVLELRPAETARAISAPAEEQDAADNHLPPREAILAEAQRRGRITTRACVERLGLSTATAKRHLAELLETGVLQKEGAGRSTVYRLTEPVQTNSEPKRSQE